MSNASRFRLNALNANSGWLDLRGITSPISYTATGTFPAGTVISIQYSNNEDIGNKGTDFTTDPTTIVGPTTPVLELPSCVARFARFVMTGFAAGADVYVGLARAKANPGEPLVDITVQSV